MTQYLSLRTPKKWVAMLHGASDMTNKNTICVRIIHNFIKILVCAVLFLEKETVDSGYNHCAWIDADVTRKG